MSERQYSSINNRLTLISVFAQIWYYRSC